MVQRIDQATGSTRPTRRSTPEPEQNSSEKNNPPQNIEITAPENNYLNTENQPKTTTRDIVDKITDLPQNPTVKDIVEKIEKLSNENLKDSIIRQTERTEELKKLQEDIESITNKKSFDA